MAGITERRNYKYMASWVGVMTLIYIVVICMCICQLVRWPFKKLYEWYKYFKGNIILKRNGIRHLVDRKKPNEK